MAYIDFPAGNKGVKERKAFWLSEDGIELISSWRREGITQEEIASKYIGISDVTLWKWTKASDALSTALMISQDVVNGKVEKALLQRALGYNIVEEKSELVEGQMRVTQRTAKHIPPDVKACLSWLYSRRSDRWRAQQEPVSNLDDEIKTAKKILVAIKEVADGDPSPAQSEAN